MNVRKPRYIAIALPSIETLVDFGTNEDKISFFDWTLSAFLDIQAGKTPGVPPDGSKALMRAVETSIPELENGYKLYMQRASGNKQDKDDNKTAISDQIILSGQPELYQRSTNGTPSVEQIRKELIDAGFSESDIDYGIGKLKGREVKNPVNYIRTIIEERQKKKPPAQQYTQRNFNDEDKEAFERMLKNYDIEGKE